MNTSVYKNLLNAYKKCNIIKIKKEFMVKRMNYEIALESLKKINNEMGYIRALAMFFMWDQYVGLPVEGTAYRVQIQNYISSRSSELINAEETKRLAEYFSGIDLKNIENVIDRAIIRSFLYKYKYTVNVPLEKMKKLTKLQTESQGNWMKARAENNYSIFEPSLKAVFELKMEMASEIDKTKTPFEIMVDESDEELNLEEVNREFDKIKYAVKELMIKIKSSNVTVDDSFFDKEFDQDELFDFVKFVCEKTGYDINRGAYGKAPHPFTIMVGPKDARITVNLSSYKGAVTAAVHEAGHAMYGYRGNDEVNDSNLWGGVPGGFHEAQSRFYENIIGKSKAFWECFYPEAQKRFKQFEGVSLDEYYRAINKSQASLKRILADEISYNLHPIIRFELEQELMSGKIEFKDLANAWNDKYFEYLGMRPENDNDGILQDIHWSVGMFGYFQSYTLGNIYGGQIRNALIKAVPNVYEEIAKGNFEPLNSWMTENVHQYGNTYTAGELIRRITGEGLNADYFIQYLNEKYNDIYNLNANN